MIKKIKKKVKKKLEYYFYKKHLSGHVLYSKIYYIFFSEIYTRQIISISKGIQEYKSKNNENEVLLVRNIHRIEKGLIMPELKTEFALNYIEETVQTFLSLSNSKKPKNKNLLSYSSNILKKYFSVVDLQNPKLQKLKKEFDKIRFVKKNTLPYKRRDSEISKINYDDVLKLFKQRRSVRFYEDKKVERELIEKAVDAATLSPSACNRQPFELIVSDENPFKDQLGRLPMGASTYYKNVPVFAALIGDLSSYFDERDRHLIYIDGSLFAMSFMLALETLGLSSCPINWPDIESKEKKLSKFLKLKPYQRCIMFIGLGYADPNMLIPYSNKKKSNQIIKYI